MNLSLEDHTIMPTILKALLDGKDKDFIILDVRDPWELDKASLPGVFNIPLKDLEQKISSLPKTELIITICHHGVRSLKAALLLIQNGKNAKSLKGGIDAYVREVDPSIPLY